MSIYTEGITFGSIDLGVENLGVWAGRARVNLADTDINVPVTKGYWSSDGDGKHDNRTNDNDGDTDANENANAYDALTVHTRDRAFTFETLYWDRVNLGEGLPTKVKIVKKKDSSIHRQVIKPSLDVQVDYAIRKEKIPAILQRFKDAGVTHVLIESQLTNMNRGGGGPMAARQAAMAGNITMKVLSHVIQALIRQTLPDATITFVSGHSTLPLCEDVVWAPASRWTQVLGLEREPRGVPRTKQQKKAFAKNTVKYVLELIYGSAACPHHKGVDRTQLRKGYPDVFSNYLTSKKKDDLADSLLQVLGFLRKCPLTTPRKKKSGKPVKRKRGEIPEPDIELRGKIDMGMYKELMKKKLKIEKPPSVRVLKATLQAWGCKGFASLRKEAMLDFFDAAKSARERAGKSTELKSVTDYKPEDRGVFRKRKPAVQEPAVVDEVDAQDVDDNDVDDDDQDVDDNNVEDDNDDDNTEAST